MSICTCAIALATVEDETTAHEQRTRPNVENEIGMLQTAPNIGSRIIYLKEPNVTPPCAVDEPFYRFSWAA